MTLKSLCTFKSLCSVLVVLALACPVLADELPTLETAPGLESTQWNLWSDAYLAHLDSGDLHGVLAGASREDLRALVRQARFSLDAATNETERGNLTAIRDILSKAAAGELPARTAAVAAAAVTPKGTPVTTLPYFPLKPNDTWFLKDANTGEDFTLKVAQQIPVNGTKAWRMNRSRPNNAEEWDAMSNDAAGLNLHVRFIRGNNAVLTPAVKFADAVTEIGKVHVTTPAFPNPATGNKTVWTVTIVAMEDVTVPAGKFTGCMKVNMLIKDSSLGTVLSKIDLWVAPKVGFVKRVGQFFGVFFVESLQKHQVAP